MFLILCHHYVVNSGLLFEMQDNPTSANSLFFYLFGMWGKTGINCFVLITGYFMCTSTITLRKFLKLYLQVVFYGFLFLVAHSIWDGECVSVKDTVLTLLPFRNIVSDSFFQAYIVWWLFIPFLNVMIRGLSKKQHLYLIVLCVSVFSCYSWIPYTYIALNPICWFSTIYVIAAFLRLYPDAVPRIAVSKPGGVFAACVVLSMVSVVFLSFWNDYCNVREVPYSLVSDFERPMALVTSVVSFHYFLNLKIGYSKLINLIGASTFGILLLHTNPHIVHWLWVIACDCAHHYDTNYYWAYAIGVCVVIFATCSFIDIIRINTIEKWMFSMIDRYMK